MRKLLIVDDEQRMANLISLYLTPYRFKCVQSLSGQEALNILEQESFDLILLDVMMPKMDGWETCREIREFSTVPIIMLTARDQKIDMIKGLKLGADDYITKPFDEDVLLARIEALLRRAGRSQENRIEFNELVWDSEQYIVSYEDKLIPLTRKEFEMLGLFLKNPKKVFSRDQLIEMLWGFDSETEGRTVDSHVRHIREKCRKEGFDIDTHLTTVWGIGYKWR
ncbi:response regulator transcription factor [Bacillus taeanensis]|uniref:DNA-binding response regulator n=1 Tax=Bacillus taeanensis TaxID=273032 RepID=A0A366Y186_9BACI|nr:response regulator transcription factor [Bacillus taeanensis]RBW70183.1 DNA-binding response regulator [Bacillus taeanensis]